MVTTNREFSVCTEVGSSDVKTKFFSQPIIDMLKLVFYR